MNNLKLHIVFLLICLSIIGLGVVGCTNSGDATNSDADPVREKNVATTNNASRTEAKKPINEDGKSPKMVFNELTHDFGKQVSGPELKHIFTFKNEGDGTLMIEKVKAG